MSSPASPSISAPIRTLALVGPSAAGKTTLSEALLQASGRIDAAGSVERDSTVSDFDPIEKRMQHSRTSGRTGHPQGTTGDQRG